MQQPIKSHPGHSPKPYPPQSHLRIADILLSISDDDDGGDEEEEEELIGGMSGFLRRHHQAEPACGFECSSPRRIVSRLFRRLKDKRRPVVWREGSDHCKESVGGQSASPSSVASVANGGGDRGLPVGTAESDGTGQSGTYNMFNMGVACSLLYLIASSKDELSKMKELRTDMEMLLENAKEEVRTRDSASETLVLKESPATSCLTDLKDVSRCSSLVSCRSAGAPYLLQGEESITISSRSIICDESRKESLEGMEQLEAELEAELERLQLQLDTESSPKSIKYQIAGDSSAAKSNGNMSSGDVIDPNEAPIEIHGGVPPIELERKLHELLESRQQERIKELEAALESVKQKLCEKEKEAMWWKDTALIMTKHVSEPPDRS